MLKDRMILITGQLTTQQRKAQMKKTFPINHEVEITIGEKEVKCIIDGSISTWDDVHGMDADGNRGTDVIDLEIDEWKVVDLKNQEIKDELILKKVEEFYDENLADKDIENAAANHADN